MKTTTYLESLEQIKVLNRAGITEAILGHSNLSRLGQLDDLELNKLALAANENGIRAILEWDLLMNQSQFGSSVETLKRMDFKNFGSVRVQDPGALEYVLSEIPEIPIQLVLETGNHNWAGIKAWTDIAGPRLERIVLSLELPSKKINEYTAKLKVPVEVLGLGPILLFYTPRPLLSNQNEKSRPGGKTDAVASSEDLQHREFRIRENDRGTFLFHGRDYSLVDRVQDLINIGVGFFRIDQRLESNLDQMPTIVDALTLQTEEAIKNFQQNYPRKVTQSFFKANATDALFKRLKNSDVQRQDANYVGKVVDLSRDEGFTVISITGKDRHIALGDSLKFITPTGAIIERSVESLRNIKGEPISAVNQGEMAVVPYVKLALNETAVYINQKSN